MPTLKEYISESDLYDEDDLALIPEDLRNQINSQLGVAASGGQTAETE